MGSNGFRVSSGPLMAKLESTGVPCSLLVMSQPPCCIVLGVTEGHSRGVCFSLLKSETPGKAGAGAVAPGPSLCICHLPAAGAEVRAAPDPKVLAGQQLVCSHVHHACLLSLSPDQREGVRPSLSDERMEEGSGQERRAHSYS